MTLLQRALYRFRDFIGESRNVTGRDEYVVCEALAFAIAAIDREPEERRLASDRDDMVVLLNAICPSPVERKRFAREAEIHVGILPDLTDWKSR